MRVKKNLIKNYGLIAVVLLVVANIVTLFVGEEEGASVIAERSSARGAVTAIPVWLQGELVPTDASVDLFTMSAPPKSNSPDMDAVSKEEKPEANKFQEKAPGTVAVAVDAGMLASEIKVLAISQSGRGTSGLVEIQGKTYVVFTGDIVDNRYLVRRIADNTIWFDSI